MDRYPNLTNGFPTVETKGVRAYDYRSGAYHNKPKTKGVLSSIQKSMPMKAFLMAYYNVSLGVAYLTHFKRSNIDARCILWRALTMELDGNSPRETMGVWFHDEAQTWALNPKRFGEWLKTNRKQVTCRFELDEYNAIVEELKRVREQ